MISKMGDKIDVLSISTPDHTHAHAAQLAMSQKYPSFCSDPFGSYCLGEVGHSDKLANQTKKFALK